MKVYLLILSVFVFFNLSCAHKPNYAKETIQKRGEQSFKFHQNYIESQEAHRQKVLKFARDKKDVTVSKNCRKYKERVLCMGDYFFLKSKKKEAYQAYELTGFYSEAPDQSLKKPYPPYLFPIKTFGETAFDLKKEEQSYFLPSQIVGSRVLNRFANNKLENLRLSVKKEKCAVSRCYKMSIYANGSIEALDSWVVDVSEKAKSFVNMRSFSIARAFGPKYSAERLIPVKVPYFQNGRVTDAVFLKVKYQTFSNKIYDLMMYPVESEISGQKYKFKRKISGLEMSEKNFNKLLSLVVKVGPSLVTMSLYL
jgi:hypothetical protein